MPTSARYDPSYLTGQDHVVEGSEIRLTQSPFVAIQEGCLAHVPKLNNSQSSPKQSLVSAWLLAALLALILSVELASQLASQLPQL